MKIIVIGLGSMGQRRVRLLQDYIKRHKKNDWLIAGVDTQKERCDVAQKTYSIETYLSITDALAAENYDSAVISTSPISHNAIVSECLHNNLNVFTEINLVDDGYSENIRLSKERNKVLFLSSTPKYRKEMMFITELAKEKKAGTYTYHIGQYLPEWHPWESYKNFFVGNKRTNGCREIFAIELPWLIEAFGDVVEVSSQHQKCSELDIDYDDTFSVVIKHSTGVIGTLNVDVVTPKAGREFKYYGENYYVEWAGTPDTLKLFDVDTKELQNVNLYDSFEHLEGYNNFVVENAYYDELENYINVINAKEDVRYSFEKDLEVLKLIDTIGA